MILLNVLILATFFSSNKKLDITLITPQIQTISESESVELKLPKGVKKENINWNKSRNEVTFLNNTSFSDMPNPDHDKEGFYWSVPNTIKVVIIEKNVKIIGGFRANGDLTIEGIDRATSEIFGTETKAWALGPDAKTDPNSSCSNGAKGDDILHDCEKWKYGAVSSTAANSTTVYVKNITINNSRTYAITSFGPKIIVDNVHVKVSRPIPDFHSNSDGISAGAGSIVRNSKFDCWDDAIKLYRDITVENVTIIHNANGAPFQLGWRNDNNVTNHTLKNILIEVKNKDYTNLALFSASLTSGNVNRNVTIDGLKVQYDVSQKVKGTDSLPLFLLKSPDAVMTLNALNVDISAPKGLAGNGKVNLNICGSLDIKNKYLCGDVSKVNGCGW